MRSRQPPAPAASWTGRLLHGVAVLQVAHRVERARDDLVALLQAVEHLEVAFAGDAQS